MDGDGLKDVITGSWPGELYWFRRASDGSFSKGETLSGADGKPLNLGNASTAFAADWEGDGDLDLLVGDIDGLVHLVLNESGGKTLEFGAAQPVRVGGKRLTLHGDSGPILADWDGDGRADLVVGSGDGRVIWCRDLSKSGAPLWGPVRQLVAASSLWSHEPGPQTKTAWGVRTKPCVADWDGDGKADLLVGDFSTTQAPRPELTAEGVAKRDALQAEMSAVATAYNTRWTEAGERAARELGLRSGEQQGPVQPPKDKHMLQRWLEKTQELLDAQEPGWQAAQMERMSALRQQLQPLQGESVAHGFVWFFRRR